MARLSELNGTKFIKFPDSSKQEDDIIQVPFSDSMDDSDIIPDCRCNVKCPAEDDLETETLSP